MSLNHLLGSSSVRINYNFSIADRADSRVLVQFWLHLNSCELDTGTFNFSREYRIPLQMKIYIFLYLNGNNIKRCYYKKCFLFELAIGLKIRRIKRREISTTNANTYTDLNCSALLFRSPLACMYSHIIFQDIIISV